MELYAPPTGMSLSTRLKGGLCATPVASESCVGLRAPPTMLSPPRSEEGLRSPPLASRRCAGLRAPPPVMSLPTRSSEGLCVTSEALTLREEPRCSTPLFSAATLSVLFCILTSYHYCPSLMTCAVAVVLGNRRLSASGAGRVGKGLFTPFPLRHCCLN